MGVATDYIPAPKRFWLHWHLPIRAHVGVDIDFTPTWYEIDNRQLVWTLTNAPAWMSIDQSTGRISGAPTAEATHSGIVLTGTRDDNQTISATFTCVVENDLFVFVSPSGNDANPGTLASPKATFVGALALLDGTTGKTIYVRGGTYTEGYTATGSGLETDGQWFASKGRTATGFHQVRGYPGETANLHFTGASEGGIQIAASYVVVSDLNMGKGTRDNYPYAIWLSSPNTMIVDCRTYDTDGVDNLTGIQAKPLSMSNNDEVVINRCVSYSNYDRGAPTNNNSCNFLAYSDVGNKASGNWIWVLNSKGWGSVWGFKLKTSGACGLVFQGCEGSNNSGGAFGVGKCLVNYCVGLDNSTQDIKSTSDNNTDAPAYWANSTFVNATLKSTYYYLNNMQTGSSAASVYERCVFAVLANTSAPIQRLWEYEADLSDNTITFRDNVYWGGDSTPFQLGTLGQRTWEQWKAASAGNVALDTTGSVFANPLFVNAAAGRLDVDSQSPCAGFSGYFAGAFQPGKTVGALGAQDGTLVNFQINGNAATPVPPQVVPQIVGTSEVSIYGGVEGLQGSGRFAAVTPHDTDVIQTTRALYIGGAGDVVVNGELQDSTDITFKAVPAGTILPIRVKRVKAATTATEIVAIY